MKCKSCQKEIGRWNSFLGGGYCSYCGGNIRKINDILILKLGYAHNLRDRENLGYLVKWDKKTMHRVKTAEIWERLKDKEINVENISELIEFEKELEKIKER